MLTFGTIGIAATLGILPPVLWLLFWLREDRLHPEPKKILLGTFLLGMLAVLVVIPLEKMALGFLSGTGLVILSWAAIEEIVKYLAAYLGGIHTRDDDEPIDPLIYIITTALGFAALENVFFLLDPLGSGSLALGVITGNIRFIGATLLHTISSAAVGIALALSFYKSKGVQYMYRIAGLAVAIALHMLFNVSIINGGESMVLGVFFFVWIAVILLLLFFEKIKNITKKTT